MSRCVAALRRCVLDWLLELVRDVKHEEAWAAGRAFAFDDSFAHEVLWRDDGGQPLPPPDEAPLEDGDIFATRARPRVVLILTFRHPGLQAAPVCPSESA